LESRPGVKRMRREKLIGSGLIGVSILGILIYYYLMFMVDEAISLLAIKATIFLLIAWIGYTLITTPPPKSIEEIEREIEEEIKKLEKSLEKEEKQ